MWDFMHKTMVIIAIVAGIGIILHEYNDSVNPIYQKQEKYSQKEFYPAKLMFKNLHHGPRFHMQLDDGSETDIPVSAETYDLFYAGDTVGFERHLTDPKVIQENDRRAIKISKLWFIFLVSGVLHI